MLAQFLAGGTAGTIQWLPPIYCFDVIKSRMQTAPQGTYTSIKDCAKKMYVNEGPQAFVRWVHRYRLLLLAEQSILLFVQN